MVTSRPGQPRRDNFRQRLKRWIPSLAATVAVGRPPAVPPQLRWPLPYVDTPAGRRFRLPLRVQYFSRRFSLFNRILSLLIPRNYLLTADNEWGGRVAAHTCRICLYPIAAGASASLLPCGHARMHFSCVAMWLNARSAVLKCPVDGCAVIPEVIYADTGACGSGGFERAGGRFGWLGSNRFARPQQQWAGIMRQLNHDRMLPARAIDWEDHVSVRGRRGNESPRGNLYSEFGELLEERHG